MTAARQQRKPLALIWLLLGIALGGGIFAPLGLRAATDNQLAVNPGTGLAISGLDPVAYFTEGKAIFGRPEVELNLDGAGHPEVYAPRFGGYDPVSIGRGRSVAGHPLIWAVVGQRLYLFYSEKTRTDFLADAGRIIDTAERKWPELANSLGQ
jgi:hypothetical protein